MEWRGFGTEEDDEYLSSVDLFSNTSSLYNGPSYYSPQLPVSPSLNSSDEFQTMHADDAVLDSFDFDLAMIRSQLNSLPYLPQSRAVPSQPTFKKSWRDVVGTENAHPPVAPSKSLVEPIHSVEHDEAEEARESSHSSKQEVCRYWLNVWCVHETSCVGKLHVWR